MLLLLLACVGGERGSPPEPPPEPAPPRAASLPLPPLSAPAAAPELPQADARTCWADRDPPSVCLAPAWPAARFSRAVWFGAVPGDPAHHLVVEQAGRIQVLGGEDEPARLWADLTDRVALEGNEEGLLALAFHPDFASSRRLFAYYRSSRHPQRSTVLSEFRVEGEGLGHLVLDSEREILVVPQPAGNHNGGSLLFGPDGFLYLGLGDGGGAGDPWGSGQDTSSLLGAVLRLDVDGPRPYAVPRDNPFAGDPAAGRPEIWAWGLRNPWRMAFDPATGTLWAGDVGQNRYEEIDRIERGGNYGWNVLEGTSCFRAERCDDSAFQAPVWVYDHDAGRSVTGGVVYRGAATPALAGTYLYGDFVSRQVWGLCADGRNPPLRVARLARAPVNLSSFGTDAAGEVVLVGFGQGAGEGLLLRLLPGGDLRCIEEG